MLHNAGAGIKKEIPDVPVLMYTCSMGWNLAPDEGGYAIYNHLPDRLFLRNKQGKYCTFGKGWKVFDLSQPEMFQRWLAMAQTAKDSGVIDGLFVDSGNLNFHFCDVGNTSKQAALEQAHADLFTEMQKIFGGEEEGGVIISNGKFYPHANGRMQEGFMAGDSANSFDRCGLTPTPCIFSVHLNSARLTSMARDLRCQLIAQLESSGGNLAATRGGQKQSIH
jgi:hypothetical protein